jgi:hypothetical protein
LEEKHTTKKKKRGKNKNRPKKKKKEVGRRRRSYLIPVVSAIFKLLIVFIFGSDAAESRVYLVNNQIKNGKKQNEKRDEKNGKIRRAQTNI